MVFGLDRPQPAERRARWNLHGNSRLPPSPGVVETTSPMESTPGMARSRTNGAFAGSPPRLGSPAGRTPLSRSLMASLNVHEEQADPLPTGRVVPALPVHGAMGALHQNDHFHDQASTSSHHSRGPSLVSMLPPLDFPEVPQPHQPRHRPMASPSTPFDCMGSEAPTPSQHPLSSPGVRTPGAHQPSLASLLHDDDQAGRRHPPLASLLGPSEAAEVPVNRLGPMAAGNSLGPRQGYKGNMAPIEPREAAPGPPSPPRRAIKPPDSFGAFEAEPTVLPLSPATMLLGDTTPAPEAPANPPYGGIDESSRQFGAPGSFQSFFSQDMWSYFSDGPRW